jgi:hypothetical protein
LTTFHCAFDVSVVGGKDAIVFDLEASRSAGTNFQSELLGDSTYAVYQEFFQAADGSLTTPLSWNGGGSIVLTAAWQHVDVCFDFAKNTRILAFNGKTVKSASGVANWPSSGTLSFGTYDVNGPSTLQEVHIDNVLVDTGACPP